MSSLCAWPECQLCPDSFLSESMSSFLTMSVGANLLMVVVNTFLQFTGCSKLYRRA